MTRLTATETEAWRVVQRVNEAWRTNRLEVLPALFHVDAVIVDATHLPLAVGRAACVDSYRAFVTSATVEAYTEGAPTVTLFGAAAVVSYPFQIGYSIGGQTYSETGSDCLMLVRGSQGWLVAWRQLVWRGP